MEQGAVLFPGLPKRNPGLKFANTFGVTVTEVGEASPSMKFSNPVNSYRSISLN